MSTRQERRRQERLEKKQSKGEKMTKDKNIKHEIIDDFLPQEVFQKIQSELMTDYNFSTRNDGIGWGYCEKIADKDEDIKKNWKYFYMSHVVYNHGIVMSPLFEIIIPILKELEVKALMRIKCNLFPYSEKIHEHEVHTDYPFTHKAAILYINTCNGYTKLQDGTKIDSVANRMLLFDASIPHQSTTCNDTTARFNINFNYF